MRSAVFGLIGLGLLAGATTARAGVQIDVGFRSGPPAECEPERVWVPPVKQCVTQNVWHEAVTEDRVDRTWIPDRFETREVRGRDERGRRVTVCERVLVEPAHWEECRKTVVVQPGYFAPETTEVIVQPGYWAVAPRRADSREDRVRFSYDDRHDDHRRDWHDRDDRRFDRR